MFWRRKPKDPVEACAEALYVAVKRAVTEGERIRVEELISASAALVGEAAIAQAGDFDPRNHDFPPGRPVFSTRINGLICGDQTLGEAPPGTICGDLRDRLAQCGFESADFPILKDVFEQYAANLGRPEDWGRVPLSIPKENYPFAQPLRMAYVLRAIVDSSLAPLSDDRAARLKSITATLARGLCETRGVLAPKIATTLAFETLNGMAKTAPMTDAALAKVHDASKPKE